MGDRPGGLVLGDNPVALSSLLARSDPHSVTRELLRCERCGEPMVDVAWVEISAFGDVEPRYVPGRARCPTPGCGTTCPVCRRELGDIHSGACSFIVEKLQDPCRVSREDCMIDIRGSARRKARE